MELSVLDLFSGIGGFSVGLETTGKFKTIAFCEKDKFCQKVLQKHWQGTKIYEDIRDIDGTKIKADVITGGFPCQPFSTAGKRKGTEDDRYLFPEMLRIIKETQARWVVGENVQGIVNMSEGKVLQGIHNDLETIGYEVQTFIIPASSQGAWHRRNRIWIVAANTNNNGSYRQKRNETKSSSNQSKDRLFVGNDKDVSNTESIWSRKPRNFNQEKRFETSSSTQFNGSSSNVSNTNNARFKDWTQQHRWQQTQNKKGINSSSRSDIISNSTPSQESWWQTQSKLCGIPDGVSTQLHKDRVNRIKALGNSIVPQIARELGLAIIKAETDG